MLSTVSVDIQPATSGANPGINTAVKSVANLAALPTANGAMTAGESVSFVNITDTVFGASATQPIAQTWYLQAGTLANVSGSIQRPTDYNASTNAVYWQLA